MMTYEWLFIACNNGALTLSTLHDPYCSFAGHAQ